MTTKTPTSNLCKFQLENISIYEFFAWFHVHGIVPGKRLNFLNINKRHWRDWMEDTKKIPLRAKYQWDNHTEHNNWKYYDRRDYFNFPIVNFPFICSNIPAAPAYRLYISQLIRYSRACGSYQDFFDRGLLLSQGFLLVKLKSSLRKLYGHHHDLADRYGMTTYMFHL